MKCGLLMLVLILSLLSLSMSGVFASVSVFSLYASTESPEDENGVSPDTTDDRFYKVI
jgi:hypothetical protein